MKTRTIDIGASGADDFPPWGDEGVVTGACIRRIGENRTVRLSIRTSGCRVSCLSGMIWLTEGNGGRDRILGTDDSCTVAGTGRIVLWAVRPSVFVVTLPGSEDDGFRHRVIQGIRAIRALCRTGNCRQDERLFATGGQAGDMRRTNP